jgi:hypothetical protein
MFLLALAALSLGGASAASATMCNIDFNATLSVTAYDFGIILPTHSVIVDIYNGTPPSSTTPGDDVFSGFSVTHPTPSTTYMHWTSPATPIVNGSSIHVGWTTDKNECPPCVTGFFTDSNGNKIPGTDVNLVAINHNGNIPNNCTVPITITNIRGACLPRPLPLAALNRYNQELAAQLQFLSPGGTLSPGESLTLPVPSPPPGTTAAADACGAYVYNYDIPGQPSARISPWVQLP